MRATKPILLTLLAITAVACFVLAAYSAADLHQRSNATSRAYLWQAPLPPAPVPEAITDVAPASLEEEVAPQAEVEVAQVVKKPRRIRPVAPIAASAVSSEVEPEDAIRIALRSKRASFEHCYEQELKKQASFSGFIVVAVSVSASGHVTEARVQEGNRRDAVVGACIVAQLRTMKLPPLTSEADLLIPIRLQAREPT